MPAKASARAFFPPEAGSRTEFLEKKRQPVKTSAMPNACTMPGTSENRIIAPISVQRGPVARMGAAQVIGKVLSARYVALQLAATMQLLTSNSAISRLLTSRVASIFPLASRNALNAHQPLRVEMKSVGNAALFLTLAFLHRS